MIVLSADPIFSFIDEYIFEITHVMQRYRYHVVTNTQFEE